MDNQIDITVIGYDKKIKARSGQSLMNVLRGAGMPVEFPCGGCGTCGKCRVKVNNPPPPKEEESMLLSQEELTKGIRLACLYTVERDMEIEPLFGNQKSVVLEKSYIGEFSMDPPIKKVVFRLPEQAKAGITMEEQLMEFVGCPVDAEYRLEILKSLSDRGFINSSDINSSKVSEYTAIIRDGKIAGIEDGNTSGFLYGVAVDIGTTTVVVSLINMKNGREEAVKSDLNPQKQYGQDVLSRISFAKERKEQLLLLRNSITGCINGLIDKAAGSSGIDKKYIYEISVAANSTMMHLFLGLNPESIGYAPYSPVLKGEIEIEADDLGLMISPFGKVYCLPAISGYVGADITAGIFATGMHKKSERSLLMDIGTNGELVLFDGQELIACSSPAGPALEGVNISCGMRAAEGAIEEVRITDEVDIKTIGNTEPFGLCGSGIIDICSELIKLNIIDASGKIDTKALQDLPKNVAARIVARDGKPAFIVTEPGETHGVYMTSRDIRQVQLAKGAIWAGITALLEQGGLRPEDLEKVYAAGAFGAHLRPESLIGIGMAAVEWKHKISFVGNTSKAGAMMCLLSKKAREEIKQLSNKVRYIELSMLPDFDRVFARSLKFPKTDCAVNGRQRIVDMLHGKNTTAASAFATEFWALNRRGHSIKEFLDAPLELAPMIIEEALNIDSDIFFLLAGLTSVPIMALDGKLEFPEKGTPFMLKPLIENKSDLFKLDVNKLKSDKNVNSLWHVADFINKKLKDRMVIAVNCRAPFTQAAQMVGPDTFMRMLRRDENFVEEVLGLSTKIFLEYVTPFIESGIEMIYISDPSASGDLISRKHFQKFVYPYLYKVNQYIKREGVKTIFHICGDTTDRLDLIRDIGPDIMSVDHKVDMGEAKKLLGEKVILAGNIDPSSVMEYGNVSDVAEATMECIKKAGHERFILMPGCEISWGTPVQNIKEMLKMGHYL